jgi:hypothetical protein
MARRRNAGKSVRASRGRVECMAVSWCDGCMDVRSTKSLYMPPGPPVRNRAGDRPRGMEQNLAHPCLSLRRAHRRLTIGHAPIRPIAIAQPRNRRGHGSGGDRVGAAQRVLFRGQLLAQDLGVHHPEKPHHRPPPPSRAHGADVEPGRRRGRLAGAPRKSPGRSVPSWPSRPAIATSSCIEPG